MGHLNSPSLRSGGSQWGLLVTTSLGVTGISCHTLAFGFKLVPFDVTLKGEKSRFIYKALSIKQTAQFCVT